MAVSATEKVVPIIKTCRENAWVVKIKRGRASTVKVTGKSARSVTVKDISKTYVRV